MANTANTDSTKMTLKDRLNDFTSRLGIVGELLRFLWTRKLWWLIPMIVALLLVGVLMVLGASGAFPFIYTLF
ncbi:MAG: DUF5989 family protein [Chloroflexota bacterium]